MYRKQIEFYKGTQKVIEESWKVNLLGRGESTGDYVQIGKR